MVAVALMIGGITLLGVVTATLASWIVQRVSEEDNAAEAATAAHIEELRDEIRRLAEWVRQHHDGGDRDQWGSGDQVKGSRVTKRIVVWGTGFVGKMVIAEVVKHPSVRTGRASG